MARYGSLRASDAEREHVVDRLRGAAAEGRIAADELEHRVGTALAARTYGELDAVIADLPARRGWPPRVAVASLRAHPLLLLAAIPVVLVAAALIAAITIASLAVAAALFLVGRRRTVYLGPGVAVLRHGFGPADRRAPGQWGYRA